MKRFGPPTLIVWVYGDWSTVIGAREYRDMLLNQSPDDEDMREYHGYRIECQSTEEMVAAYNEFRNRLKLKVFFGMEHQSGDGVVRAIMQSDDGYSRNPRPHCDVQINAPTADIQAAAEAAIKILRDACK